ncbi:MAG: TldD/PmbA family protein [Thermoleophilia bacterium]|jgi:PmbA protein|nr:TldD/PmbA family protein [Thermoleophilia bacterium]
MFELLDAALERAGALGDADVEVYGERSTSRRVKVYGGEVEQLTAARRTGLGVRIVRGGAAGYAYTSELSPEGVDVVVRRAFEHAAVGDPDEFVALPEPGGAPADVDPYDARVEGVSDDARVELALAVEAAARAADPRVKTVEDTIYADGEGEVYLASTTGVRGSYRASQCYGFAYVLAEEKGQVETGISFTVGRALPDLDPEACGAEAAARACRLLGARKCPSMKATVVLDPFVAASVIGVLSSALTADAVQKGRSLFAGREGQAVAAAAFSLTDDGRHPDGLDSAPFDGEGTPSRRTPLVAGGVLQGFLYDTYTARKAGRASTGNGLRGSYQALPGVHPTNLLVEGTATPVDEIVAGIERGVLVTDAVGVHSGANPVSGEFSVGISGVLIESGRLTTPVREVTLAGDLLGMLRGVVATGDDARWVPGGSILTPSLVIEGMAIGGT